MIVLNIELDNFLIFNHFTLNLSYPKKLVNSTILDEHLAKRPNFRYKKLVIIMGANATGKTCLSKIMMAIFNFMSKKEYSTITPYIEDRTKDASFSIDLAFSDYTLYRINGTFKARSEKEKEYKIEDIIVSVQSEQIMAQDSYERCISRLISRPIPIYENYIKTLESVPYLTWSFEAPFSANGKQLAIKPFAPELYAKVLEKTLMALDPRIQEVIQIQDDSNTYLIRFENHFVIIKDGYIIEPDKLSSGTKDGIGVANIVTAIKTKVVDFFFCDEIFSHIHTISEQAFISEMIDMLGYNQQLFITTHNTDILDMDLPLHSFAFLRRDGTGTANVSCVFASEYLKKNNVSLKNAVENDLFSAAPDIDSIFSIGEIFNEVNK